jgi:glycerate 2-kinase
VARRAVVCPDSFKGTLTAAQVADALAEGLRAGGLEVDTLPAADGGEGTLAALGGEVRREVVSGPLGDPVEAEWSLLPDGRAVVEAAQASGLGLVPEPERDAWAASTRGTGELIVAAAQAGAAHVLVAVGGTATTDGGAGAVAALDEAGIEVELTLLCDVQAAWEDAPRVFGPQKGADPATVTRLERRLDALADRAPRDPRGVPRTGAGGGLSGGLWAFRSARLLPGASYVLDAIGFDTRLPGAVLCVTGEGGLDAQTLRGKVVAEVAARCRRAGVPCHAVVGRDELGPEPLGLASVREAGTPAELTAAGAALAQWAEPTA